MSEVPSSSTRPDPPRLPLPRRIPTAPTGRGPALPLSSQSHTAWAAALVGLADHAPVLVELTAAGSVRWWSPHDGDQADPISLVWAQRAEADVQLAGLALGRTAPDAHAGLPGVSTAAAVVATRTGDCSVTTGTGADLTNAGGRSLVVDALMLYLGLPTAAEPRTPAHLVCSVWLDRLLAATVLEPGRVTTWTAAIRHHPLSSGGTTAPELAAITQDLGAMGWDPMRLAVAAGSTDWVDLDPVGAAWMDRGAFARRLLDRYPDLDDQCRVLSAVMPTRLAHTVRHAVSASLTHRR